jgi:hypothetical protein
MSRAFLAGLLALVACRSSSAPTPSFSGTWEVEQPSAWTDFRFTLSQTACANAASVSGPCDSAFAGNATVTPLVCQVTGMRETRACGCPYTCDTVFPVTGKVAGDSVTLNFFLFTDASSIYFVGQLSGNGNIIGYVMYTDDNGVIHTVGGPCNGYPSCLDAPGGELDFAQGGVAVVSASRRTVCRPQTVGRRPEYSSSRIPYART